MAVAATVKLVCRPAQRVTFDGCDVIAIGVLTVSATHELLTAGAQVPLITQRYTVPLIATEVGLTVSVAVVTPEYGAPLARLVQGPAQLVALCH